MTYQLMQYNDGEGNRTLAAGEVEELKAYGLEYHREHYEEELTWTLGSDHTWTTEYKYGMLYAIEQVKTV